MSGSDEDIVAMEETLDIQEAQPLYEEESLVLGHQAGRGSGRSNYDAVGRLAGGVGGSGVGSSGVGGPAAATDSATASGGVAVVVRTKAQVYGEIAEGYFEKLEVLNPLKRKVEDLMDDIASAEDKVVTLKAELVEVQKKVQKMQPTVDNMQEKMREMTEKAGKD